MTCPALIDWLIALSLLPGNIKATDSTTPSVVNNRKEEDPTEVTSYDKTEIEGSLFFNARPSQPRRSYQGDTPWWLRSYSSPETPRGDGGSSRRSSTQRESRKEQVAVLVVVKEKVEVVKEKVVY